MHISRVKLNPRRRGAVQLLDNPRAMHAAVESAFPDPDHGRVLWRTDQHEHAVHLIVVSPQRPDLTHVVEQGGWPDTAPYEVKDYEPFLDSLRAGAPVSFHLKANPSKRIGSSKMYDRKGSTYPHVTVEQQLDWWAQRAESKGLILTPDSFTVSERGSQVSKRPGAPATHSYATFTGQAHIGDINALCDALTNGVGRGKAYGLGLLTVMTR